MIEEELYNIYGGSSVSTTLLNTFIRFISTSIELGRALGSAIRRSLEKTKCY